MPSARSPRSNSDRPPAGLRSVRADEVMLLSEAGRRLGWQTHARRKAKREGLCVVRWGSTDYVLGEDLIAFFRRLRDHGNGQDDGG